VLIGDLDRAMPTFAGRFFVLTLAALPDSRAHFAPCNLTLVVSIILVSARGRVGRELTDAR
jgi:hypothetical protein